MNDLSFSTICCLGVLFVGALLVLPMLMRMFGGRGNPYAQAGSESPQYDDPNIESRGAFGRRPGFFGRGSARPGYDDPNIRSRGSFGGFRGLPGRLRGGGTKQGSSGFGRSSGGRVDSDDINSRGSFGGKR